MPASILDRERERELLSQAILETLNSWPLLYRRVFSDAHYRGESAERIAASLGMGTDTVRTILRDCDRRLRKALNSFREEKDPPLRYPAAAVNRWFH